MAKDNLHLGTATLMYFLQIAGNSHALDEVVEALNGSADSHRGSRHNASPKSRQFSGIAFDSAMMHLSLLMTLASVPKQHSLVAHASPKKPHRNRNECPSPSDRHSVQPGKLFTRLNREYSALHINVHLQRRLALMKNTNRHETRITGPGSWLVDSFGKLCPSGFPRLRWLTERRSSAYFNILLNFPRILL